MAGEALGPLGSWRGAAREVVLIERLAKELLDHRLAADVQLAGGAVQFVQHGRGEIDIHALNGRHHASRVGEEAGDVLAAVGAPGDGLG